MAALRQYPILAAMNVSSTALVGRPRRTALKRVDSVCSNPVTRSLTRQALTLKAPTNLKESTMPKFVIERVIPNIGAASAAELQAISQKSCGVLQELGPEVQWVHSYVTGDKIYCVYNAANEALVREHTQRGGFPADSEARVVTTIDPTTAEA